MSWTTAPRPEGAIGRTLEGLLQLLRQEGLIGPDQAGEALRRAPVVAQELRRDAARSGRRGHQREPAPAEILARLGFRDAEGEPLSEDRIAEIFARAAGVRYVKLDPLKLDARLVTATLSLPFARRHGILPIAMDAQRLIVATDDPYAMETLEEIRGITGRRIEPWVASRSDIVKHLRDIFGFRWSVDQAADEFTEKNDLHNLEALVRLKSGEEIEASDTHVVNAVEYLLSYALEQGASDIHVEPHRTETHIRMRIDGVLHRVHTVPRQLHAPIVSRIKSMGRLDIAEKRRPQDGRLKTAKDGREVEIRLSTLPTAFGEKLVMRIFDPEVLVRELGDLGFFQGQLEVLRPMIYRPHGMILVTGPTGSGKTTTLYSVLREVATPEVNVITVEDPIEIVVDELNQVAANARTDLDFAGALRTILRQDPDIVMVGEIRDGETARMAAQAALTGHLVLSTVHTNDAPGSITRLADLGLPRYLISSTLLGALGQRLARRICPRCKTRTHLSVVQCRELDIPLKGGEAPKLPVFEGEGCQHCRETGYRGRTGVYEVMAVTPALRERITLEAPLVELRRTAVADGMMTLREAAIKKMAQGLTTFSEVLRVTVSGDV